MFSSVPNLLHQSALTRIGFAFLFIIALWAAIYWAAVLP